MPYSNSTIASTIDRINRNYFLPAIQRPFVWGPEQIIALFDSLMKGYPISSFLFWDLEDGNSHNWQIYKFAENFRFGEVHNEQAYPSGEKVTLVLDGQQRLTSLLIGLRGSFTAKAKGKRWDNPDAWQRKHLYLDLLFDPEVGEPMEGEAEDIEPSFRFEFLKTAPVSSYGSVWMKVGDILKCQNEESLERHKNHFIEALPDKRTWVQVETIRRNFDRLYSMVWRDQIISFYTEDRQDLDRVLSIFVRANDGGTKLSKSDLMLSVLSSKWTDISAREEIYNFVETINNRLDRKNAITKDFVMKACLLLSELDHVYKVKNFNNANLDVMRRNWDSIQTAIRRAFRLVNRFGVDRENMTSLNAMLPIAYYVYRADVDLLARSTEFEFRNAERVRRWIIAALINGVFGGQSDSTLAVARNTIANAMKEGRDFPLDDMNANLSRHLKRPAHLTGEAVDAAMEIRYGQKLTFLLVSLLYDDQNWGTSAHQMDHIFPASRLTRKSLMGMNIPYTKVEEILSCADRLGNLQLLTHDENLEKSDQPFEDWIRTRDISFLARHHIPDDEHLWSLLMLPQFVAKRERLIRERIERLAATPRPQLIDTEQE